jgi:hypothetical protein
MKAAGSFQERQLHPNTGEQLFEEYCNAKQVQFFRLGFNEKNQEVPYFYEISPFIRNLPDYYVVTKTRRLLVMVKGTGNMKKKEVDMIPQFIEWYGSKEVSLYYAFCFKDKTVAFRTPDQVIELYQKAEADKRWTDGVIYRTLNLNE